MLTWLHNTIDPIGFPLADNLAARHDMLGTPNQYSRMHQTGLDLTYASGWYSGQGLDSW